MGTNLLDNILITYDDITNLGYTLALLNWDQSTYITKNGHKSRAEIIETISKISHELLISDKFYDQICQISEKKEFSNINDFQQKEIKKIKKEVEKARKIPSKLTSELAKITSFGMAAWQDAKKNNNDKVVLLKQNSLFYRHLL